MCHCIGETVTTLIVGCKVTTIIVARVNNVKPGVPTGNLTNYVDTNARFGLMYVNVFTEN
jgi:hypothetical protein